MPGIDKKRIAGRLENLGKCSRFSSSGCITLGFDGYIDQIWQIVELRTGNNKPVLYNKMKNLGEAIVKCGDGGFSHEVISKRRSYGGFTCNTGMALGRLGAKPNLIGMYGKNSTDPLFEKFNGICKLISIGDPAVDNIYEFEDGKIMFPCVEEIMGFDWDTLVGAVGFQKLKEIYLNSDIIALGYWSLMPAFDEVISKICENFIDGGRCKQIFFDFADIRKRGWAELEHTLNLLMRLNKNVPMTLSLNENEAELLFSQYGQEFNESRPEDALVRVREKIGLNEIIVHTPHVASAANAKEGAATAIQDCCPNPVITAGAGDTFNGGYLAASLAGLSIKERLAVGNAATGFYVRNGFTPDIKNLIGEL